MKRNILITGGAGFIGSHVVRLFVGKYPDYRIINLDRLTYAGNLANLRDVENRPNYTFVKGDICDYDAMRSLFAEYDIDGVIHLAAESHVDRSIRDPFTFARTNVMGTLTLLQAAREHWNGAWEGRRFHHISTDEVYGALPFDGTLFTEQTRYAYLGSYYAQKVLGVENPRIGLLNIGAEESKGDTLRRETYQKLKEAGEAGHFNFTGNIEAKEAMLGECDVIVADGYSGNIMLKSIEGTGKLLSIKLKEMLMHSTGTKLAALLLKGQLGDFKKMLDANEVGGTALLGISKPVVKAHGSASEVGICNAVRQAMEVARSGIIDDIAQNIDKMRIEQKAE